MEANATEFDFAARKDLMKKRLVEIMYDEQPVTFLMGSAAADGSRRRFDNVEILRQRPCVLPPLWVVSGVQMQKQNRREASTVKITASN